MRVLKMNPEQIARANSALELLYNLTTEQKKKLELFGLTKLRETKPEDLDKAVEEFIKNNVWNWEGD